MSDLLLKMPLNYEPLRKNRWLFRFPADLGIQEWWLSSASRPTITQNETKIPFLNTETSSGTLDTVIQLDISLYPHSSR